MIDVSDERMQLPGDVEALEEKSGTLHPQQWHGIPVLLSSGQTWNILLYTLKKKIKNFFFTKNKCSQSHQYNKKNLSPVMCHMSPITGSAGSSQKPKNLFSRGGCKVEATIIQLWMKNLIL